MIDDIFNTAMHCGLCGNKKLVILVILYDEKERGDKCTASCAQIAQMCGVELRTVSRIVKELRGKGILSSEDTNGYTFRWSVHIDALPAPIAVADVLARAGKQFSKKVYWALVERDGQVCQVPTCTATVRLCIDHIVPRSAGGNDDLSNLHLLCRRHNSIKANRPWHEFIEIVFPPSVNIAR